MDQLDTYPHALVGADAAAPVQPSQRQVLQARRLREQERGAARPAEVPRAGAADRVAPAILQLMSEANAANPSRDKASDGTWGDARHLALGSATDHNPWLKVAGIGYVRAGDIDVDGLDLATAFEVGRQKAAAGQLPQVVGGGYFILNGRITRPDFSGWAAYTGDPHVTHGHVSSSRTPAAFLSSAGWGLFAAAPPASTPAAGGQGWTGPDATGRGVTYRAQYEPSPQSNGQRVADLQAFMRRVFPAYAGDLAVDGWYGPQLSGVVAEFAARSGIDKADGLNVGPKIATALWRSGFDR